MRKRIFSVLLCVCMALTLLPVAAFAETSYTISTAASDFTVTGGTLTSDTTYTNLTDAVAAIITDSSGTADVTFDTITANNLTISSACDLTFRGSLTFTNVATAITLDADNIQIHNHADLTTSSGYILYASNNTSFEQIEGTLTGELSVTASSLAVKDGTINGTVDVNSGSVLTMDGGTINGKVNMYASSFVMNGGTVNNVSAEQVYVAAVYSGSDTCSVTINGGKIYAENTSSGSSGDYGAYAILNCGGSIKLAKAVDISATATAASGNSASVYYSSASKFTTIDASGVTGFTSEFTFGPSASAMGSLSARAVWMSGTTGNIGTLVSGSKLKVIGDSGGTYTGYVPAAYGTGVIMKNPSASFSQIAGGDITEATFTQSGSGIAVSYTADGVAKTTSYTDTSISNVTEDILAADTTPGCDLIYGLKDKTQSVNGDLKLDTGSSAVINLFGKLSGTVDVIGTGTVNSYLDAGGFTGKTKSQINLNGGTVSGTGAQADGALWHGVLYLTDANLVVDGATIDATGGDAVVAVGTSNVTVQSGSISATGYGVYMTHPSSGGNGGKLTVSGGSITSTGSIGALLNIKVDFGMSGGSITGSTADLSVQDMSDSASVKTFTITGAIGFQKISIGNASNPVIFDVTGATLPSDNTISVAYNNAAVSHQLFHASKENYKDFLQNTTITGGSFNLAVYNVQPAKDSPTTVDLYAATSDKTAQVNFFDSASATSPFYTENLYSGSYLSDVKPTMTQNFDGWKNDSGNDVTDMTISAGTTLHPIYSTSLTGEAKNITATSAEIDLTTNGNEIFYTSNLCATADAVVTNHQQPVITPSNGSAVLTLTGLTPGTSYTYYMAARNANSELSDLVTVTFTTEKQTPKASSFEVSEDTGLTYNGAAQKVKVAPSSSYGTSDTGDITVFYKKVKDGSGLAVSGQTISEPVEAGTYEIYITTTGGSTFKAIATPLKLGEYTIAQKALTITANAQSIPYGGSVDPAVGNATAAGLAGTDKLDSVTLNAAGTSVAVGGTITPSAAVIKNGGTDVTANYAITYSSGTLTITKSTPTLTFGSYPLSYTYSGEALSNPAEDQLTLSGALYSDAVFTWYKGNSATGTPLSGAPKDAGTYVVTAVIPATDNTNASETVTSGTITVSPKSITPTIELPSEAQTYDGKPKTPVITVKDDTAVIPDAEYTISYSENTAAGTATVTVTDKEGGNYALTNTNAQFTISPAAVTVKPQSFSITAGNTAPTLALTYTGVFSGDTITPSDSPTFKLTKSNGTEIALSNAVKAAGTYTITWSNMASTNFETATNYTVTKAETGMLTVSDPITNYTVTFNPNGGTRTGGGSLTQTIAKGNSAATPTVTRSGYTFAGWDKTFSNVTSNLTVNARWTATGGSTGGGGGGGSSGGGSASGSTDTARISSGADKINVPVSVSGGAATVSVTDAQAKAIASDAKTTGTVKIDVSKEKVDEVVVPSKLVFAADGAALEIALPTGTVTLDKPALASVTDKGDMKVSMETVDNSKLTETQKATLGSQASSATVVDVNVYVNSARTSTFGDGTITVSVPYTLKPGENPDSITVWFLKDDGSIEPKTASYADGKVTFTTEHLSKYLIVDFPFADVAESAWCYGSVAYAYDNGLFSGTSATTFSPNATANRQMIWMVLARMDGETPANMAEAKAWAVENHISDGSNPTGIVTRQQMAAILYRYAQHKGYDTTQGGMAVREFSDYDSISAYAQSALAWAVNAGLVQGKNNQVMPFGNATRAQVATILQRFSQNVAK